MAGAGSKRKPTKRPSAAAPEPQRGKGSRRKPAKAVAGSAKAKAPPRQPNYEATIRCIQLYLLLLQAPQGRSVSALAAELGVSTRTIARYANILTRSVFDQDHLPLVEVQRRGNTKVLKARSSDLAIGPMLASAASMFFSIAAVRALRGTDVGDSSGMIWKMVLKSLPLPARRALEDAEKRFFYVPFAPKDYRDCGETLDALFAAVLRRDQLAIAYRKPNGRRSRHLFDPFTLVLYRDAIYVLGRSDRHKNPIYLAADRVEEVEKTGEKFRLPKDYDPEKLTRDGFGIWSGKEAEVSLRLSGRAAEQVPERFRHRTRKISHTQAGDILLQVTVNGWQEFAWWILSWGGDVEVLGPPDLREYVASQVRAAARFYDED